MKTETRTNFILDADSYKMSHFLLYPKGTNALFSYIEARTKDDVIIPFGLQLWIKRNLLTPITIEDVNEAESIALEHGEPFNREAWVHIIEKYNGYIPVTIRSLPEGTPFKSNKPLVTVVCEDEKVFWIASYIETTLQRAVWYPTTIASNDFKNRRTLKWFYEHGSDAGFMLDYALHSFASRGVAVREQAEVGGLAHFVFFKGTDDLIALKAARDYYNCRMPASSVIASEHTVQCSYGKTKDNQREYLKRMIEVLGQIPGPVKIVSCVMDGYDIYREVETLCEPELVAAIKATGGKFVVRPDSGDPLEVIPKLLAMLEKGFGVTMNSKNKKVLNSVGIIQGDGIDHNMMYLIADRVHSLGFAPENVIYGSGGGLLQKVNRDTFSFAQKGSAVRIGDTWIDTVKDPITDSGKKSKGGRHDDPMFVTFYSGNGKLLVDDSLNVIRERALTAL